MRTGQCLRVAVESLRDTSSCSSLSRVTTYRARASRDDQGCWVVVIDGVGTVRGDSPGDSLTMAHLMVAALDVTKRYELELVLEVPEP